MTTAAAGTRRMAKKFIGFEVEGFSVPIVEASAAVAHHSAQSGSCVVSGDRGLPLIRIGKVGVLDFPGSTKLMCKSDF